MANGEQWNSGVGEPGLKFFHGWLPADEAERIFATANGDSFPWNLKPKLYGTKIPQHSYHYKRSKKKTSEGLDALEALCQRICSEFDCKLQSVYCNRFQDVNHKIDWHQDKYASHIFVLSLGGHRGLEFRTNDATKEITRYDPCAGDLYFMSLQHNKKFYHRVLSAEESGDTTSGSTRISFVFFVSAPFDKKEYRVGLGESIFGGINSWMS
jgi:alkylated DNA repair dioxygenase AlkB